MGSLLNSFHQRNTIRRSDSLKSTSNLIDVKIFIWPLSVPNVHNCTVLSAFNWILSEDVWLMMGRHWFRSMTWCRTDDKPLFSSSLPCAAYMRQWIGSAWVQIMACRLFGTKPLAKPMLDYCQLNPQEKTVKFNQNTKVFIHENVSENIVCEIAAIFLGGWGDELNQW